VPVNDVLTPQEASHIAANAYFTLKNWINSDPTAGIEATATVQNRVLGAGNIGSNQPAGGGTNPTLSRTSLATSRLTGVFPAMTGLGTSSGFGYALTYQGQGRTHAIVAVRGTRPEMAGSPDLLTDLRAGMTSFGDYGPVHKGFKRTFDTALPNLERCSETVMKADVVHCVGHSLGGGVATLLAASYADRGKAVKLYTFGCPRVGAMGTHVALERRIGKENIFRITHDLDPISLIAPFPYIHVNGGSRDRNNMTIPSPSGSLFSTANHDMARYIDSVGRQDVTWDFVRSLHGRVDYDNAVLAKWLLHEGNDPGWVQYASAKTLGLLFKLFSHVLANISVSAILGLTAIDFLAEILMKGMHKAKALGEQIVQLLGYAAQWAGITIASGVQFTEAIIAKILERMLSALTHAGMVALSAAAHLTAPLPLMIAGTFLLTSSAAF
jgi:triacylglycerol lipase